MSEKFEFEFNGFPATVIIPDNFNGRWIWKTEFFYAYDNAEQSLLNLGFARVYYQISDMYGNDLSVRLMHKFHQFVVKKFNLCQKTILFGFSRGGLYAFNYALFYPEAVEKIYLDAPVLNLKSWPNKSCLEFDEMLERYNLNESAIASFKNSPVDNLEEFSKNGIPVLIVAGAVDTTVPHKENCQIMVDFYKSKGLKIKYILKENCGHHPHGLEDVSPIIDFVI